MFKKAFTVLSFNILALLTVTFTAISQEAEIHGCRLMFYNVENLFDTFDDPLKDDDEFLPGGERRWSYSRYRKKLNSVYQVIAAAGEWTPPAVVAFCEVENRSVLEDLITNTYLLKYNYGIIHEDSPDRRGIDVCLIFRKEITRVIAYDYLEPEMQAGEIFRSRRSLYVKCLLLKDTVHLFINHWPSRRGGVLSGEGLRIRLGYMLREKIDSILLSDSGRSKIIVMGDFNCTPEDKEIAVILHSPSLPDRYRYSGLIDLSAYRFRKGAGTYRYMGIWEMPDQVLVSEYLCKCKTGLTTDSSMFRIFGPGFLLHDDPGHPGKSPLSTYYGYRYTGGFSDHLPVLIDLRVR
jgi:hypothetical protein